MHKIRPYKFLEKNLGAFLGKHISPKTFTILSFLMMCVASFFYIKKEIIFGGVSILIAGFFDALDGTVARAIGKDSTEGAFFDKYFDKLGETIMAISLSYFRIIDPVVGMFFITGLLSREVIFFICKNEKVLSDDEMFSNKGIVVSPRIIIFLAGFYKINLGFLIVGFGIWMIFLMNSFFWFRKIFRKG